MYSETVVAAGAVCFGIVVGYVTYRTLTKQEKAAITDIAAVISAVGGGAVATWFGRDGTDTFGWYSFGLLGGMVLYLLVSLAVNGKSATGAVMAGRDDGGLPG